MDAGRCLQAPRDGTATDHLTYADHVESASLHLHDRATCTVYSRVIAFDPFSEASLAILSSGTSLIIMHRRGTYQEPSTAKSEPFQWGSMDSYRSLT